MQERGKMFLVCMCAWEVVPVNVSLPNNCVYTYAHIKPCTRNTENKYINDDSMHMHTNITHNT